MTLDHVKLVAMAADGKLSKEALRYFQAEGRKGGLLGGKVRADKLTPARRREIAKKAAAARRGSNYSDAAPDKARKPKGVGQ
jgi:hypothetical protein